MVKRIATPLFVSPNGDGRKDTARISFELPEGRPHDGGDRDRRRRRAAPPDGRPSGCGRGRHTVDWDGRDDARPRACATAPTTCACRCAARAARSPARGRSRSRRRRRGRACSRRCGCATAGCGCATPARRARRRSTRLPHRRRRARARSRASSARAAQNVHVWDGFVAACGACRPATTRSRVTVQNKALVAGSSPPKLPPTRASAAPRTGVTFTDARPGAAARAGPRRHRRARDGRRAVAAVPLEADAARVDPPAAPRRGQRPHARLPRAGRRADRRLHARGRRRPATAPARRSPCAPAARAPVLVVLPAIAWQGRNAVDGDRDGFDETLEDSHAVGVERAVRRRPPARRASRRASRR